MLIYIEKRGKKESHVVKDSEKKTLCGIVTTVDDEVGFRDSWLSCRICKEKLNAKLRDKDPVVPRITVLNAIMSCFIQVWQVRDKVMDCAGNMDRWLASAEEFIKLLEGLDCGSWGGYDRPNSGIPTVFLRFEWLVYKYNLPINLKDAGKYEDVRKYFVKEGR